MQCVHLGSLQAFKEAMPEFYDKVRGLLRNKYGQDCNVANFERFSQFYKIAILARKCTPGKMAMDKLDAITRERKKAHQKLVSLKSKVYEAFLQMEQAAFSDGALPGKTKELIAIGISVQMDCESCMRWHIDQAAAHGATYREILEAIEVGIEMGENGIRSPEFLARNLSRV